MDDITKQILLEKVRIVINDYKNHADELLKLINIHFDKETDRLKNISIITLQRYYTGLISISTLIEKFKFYNSIEFTYALILRALILDFITIEYLKSHKEFGIKNWNKCLEQLNYLSAAETNRYCNSLVDDKEEFRKFISEFLFPENFEIDSNTGNCRLKRSKPIKTWEMACFFKDKKEPFAYDSYRLYNHYSLFEHINNLTFEAMNGDNSRDIENLFWSLFYIFHGHFSCLEILNFFPKHSQEIIDKRRIILKLIDEI